MVDNCHKHHLLEHWPQPDIVCDVARIVSFVQFYIKFIPQFELRIAPLCNLTTKFEYTDPVTPHWTSPAQDSFEDIKQSILLDPCLIRFNHQRLTSFAPISHLAALAMWCASLGTTRPPMQQ
jgi:hypothetical protein